MINEGAKFNHDKTGFVLIGAHTSTRCESCHARGIFKGTPKKCISCHSKSGQIAATSKPISHIRLRVLAISAIRRTVGFGWYRWTTLL